jgi:hypothetical protein
MESSTANSAGGCDEEVKEGTSLDWRHEGEVLTLIWRRVEGNDCHWLSESSVRRGVTTAVVAIADFGERSNPCPLGGACRCASGSGGGIQVVSIHFKS